MSVKDENLRHIFLSYHDAAERLDKPHSCLHEVTTDKTLPLLPKFLNNIKAGITYSLDRELNLYSDGLNGIPVGYNNIKLKDAYGSIVGDEPFIHVDIVGDFIIFRPEVGRIIEGVINKIGRDHIGCLIHGLYNASALKPPGSRSSLLKIGDTVLLQVTHLTPVHDVLTIFGDVMKESLKQLKKIRLAESQSQAKDMEEQPSSPMKTDVLENNDREADVGSLAEQTTATEVSQMDNTSDSSFVTAEESLSNKLHHKLEKEKRRRERAARREEREKIREERKKRKVMKELARSQTGTDSDSILSHKSATEKLKIKKLSKNTGLMNVYTPQRPSIFESTMIEPLKKHDKTELFISPIVSDAEKNQRDSMNQAAFASPVPHIGKKHATGVKRERSTGSVVDLGMKSKKHKLGESLPIVGSDDKLSVVSVDTTSGETETKKKKKKKREKHKHGVKGVGDSCDETLGSRVETMSASEDNKLKYKHNKKCKEDMSVVDGSRSEDAEVIGVSGSKKKSETGSKDKSRGEIKSPELNQPSIKAMDLSLNCATSSSKKKKKKKSKSCDVSKLSSGRGTPTILDYFTPCKIGEKLPQKSSVSSLENESLETTDGKKKKKKKKTTTEEDGTKADGSPRGKKRQRDLADNTIDSSLSKKRSRSSDSISMSLEKKFQQVADVPGVNSKMDDDDSGVNSLASSVMSHQGGDASVAADNDVSKRKKKKKKHRRKHGDEKEEEKKAQT